MKSNQATGCGGEHEPALRAVVVFATAGYSWERSSELQARLLASVSLLTTPVFFIHAANDDTTAPGATLAARLSELGKPHRLRIYPAIGRSPEDGHDFLYSGVPVWENDVFAFLAQYTDGDAPSALRCDRFDARGTTDELGWEAGIRADSQRAEGEL